MKVLTLPLRTKHKAFVSLIIISIVFLFTVEGLYLGITQRTAGFVAYYTSARLLREGHFSAKVYDPHFFRAAVFLYAGADDIYNANPPTMSLILLPLSNLSADVAKVTWMVINVIFLFIGLTLLGLTFAHKLSLATFLGLFSIGMLFKPVLTNLRFGQVYILIFLLTTLTVIGLHRRNAWLSGITLALAIILKTAGWALIPWLVITKRWRPLLWTIGTGLTVILVLLPQLPLSIWTRYLQVLRQATDNPFVCVTSYQTTRSLLCRIFGFSGSWDIPGSSIFNVPWIAIALIIGLMGGTFVLNWYLYSKDRTASLMATITWGVIFLPLGEQHHHTVMLIPCCWLLIAWQNGQLMNLMDQVAYIMALLLYIIPWPVHHDVFQVGWVTLLAYIRVYGAWLILLIIYNQAFELITPVHIGLPHLTLTESDKV